MNITLRTPLISREEQLRNQYNYQMQTFNNEQSMDLDANSAQQSPVKAVEEKQFLCEELFMRLPTFNPDNYLIFIWRCLICFFCIWYFYLIPVFMFFDYRIVRRDLVSDTIFDVLCALVLVLVCDIFVCLNTGYYFKGLLILDKGKIIKRYLLTRFPFDFIAICAVMFQLIFSNNQFCLIWFPYFFYFKIPFVLEMDEFILAMLQLHRKSKATYQTLRLILTILFIINLFACFFYGAGQYWIQNGILYSDEPYTSWLIESSIQNNICLLPLGVQYEYAFYWAVTTMLTVGYGDITGKNPLEVFVAILTMLFACVIFAILINAFQDIFSDINQRNWEFEKKMTDINRFMREKNIDYDTQKKVRRFLSFIYSEKVRDFNEQICTLNQLGPQLKDEVIMQSYGILLRRIYWFAPFSLDLQKKVAYLITEQMYSNDEVIFYQGRMNTTGNNDEDSLYSISLGGIQLMMVINDSYQDGLIFQTLEIDTLFGELTFLTGQPRSLTAVCFQITRLYRLSRLQFMTAIQAYPLDYQIYCQLRDKIMFNDFSAANINCFSCMSQRHLAVNCNKTHYSPDPWKLVRALNKQQNDRAPFKRKTQKHSKKNQQKLEIASWLMQQAIEQNDDDEESEAGTPMTARLLQRTDSLLDEKNSNENDLASEIIWRLEQRKKQAYIEIDQVANFKNYFPKFNIVSLIKMQTREKRMSRKLRYI